MSYRKKIRRFIIISMLLLWVIMLAFNCIALRILIPSFAYLMNALYMYSLKNEVNQEIIEKYGEDTKKLKFNSVIMNLAIIIGIILMCISLIYISFFL